jgi:hypothetical protein
MEPLGILIGGALNMILDNNIVALLEAIITAFASGTFIYVAAIGKLLELIKLLPAFRSYWRFSGISKRAKGIPLALFEMLLRSVLSPHNLILS